MSVYFIGCLHLGHENMAKHRGFNSSNEHDQLLIRCINSKVSKRDKLFILGDVTMEKSKDYWKLDRINGLKQVIMGNHDRHQDVSKLLDHVDGVCGCMKYKESMLSHIPIHPSEFEYRVSFNIHAHIHERGLDPSRYFNTDAKRLTYIPRSFDEIISCVEYYKK